MCDPEFQLLNTKLIVNDHFKCSFDALENAF